MASKLTLAEILAGVGKGERYQAPKDRYGFYSPTEEAIVNVNMGKGRGPQWEAELSKQQGVTKSELQDAGLIDYLGTTEGPITKEMVFDYFQANRPKMERDVGEVGGPKPLSIFNLELPKMGVNREVVDDPNKIQTRKFMDVLRGMENFAGYTRGKPSYIDDYMAETGLAKPPFAQSIKKQYYDQFVAENPSLFMDGNRPQDWQIKQLNNKLVDRLTEDAKAAGVETPRQYIERRMGYEMMQNPPRIGIYPDPDPLSNYRQIELQQNRHQLEATTRGPRSQYTYTQDIVGSGTPEGIDEGLRKMLREAIVKRNAQTVDTTRHSAWAKPQDPQTYREELFYTPPEPHMPYSKTTAHWGDTPNPTAHTLSDIVELKDGTKAVNLLESQADTQIAAHKAGGWAPSQKEFDQAEAAQQASGGRLYDSESELHYASGVDPIDYSVGQLTPDRFVIRNHKNLPIGYYIPSTSEFQLGEEGMLTFANAQPQLKNWVEASIGHAQTVAARDDLMKKVAYPQRVPLSREGKSKGVKGKAMEWEKFNLKRLLQRAVDVDADGIMIPNSEELVAKYGKGDKGGQEKAYKKFYDKNLPQEWQKYQKQFGTGAPEVREGPDGVKRLFLPINEKLREEIKTRGLPMYGKRGLADVLGEQYA